MAPGRPHRGEPVPAGCWGLMKTRRAGSGSGMRLLAPIAIRAGPCSTYAETNRCRSAGGPAQGKRQRREGGQALRGRMIDLHKRVRRLG